MSSVAFTNAPVIVFTLDWAIVIQIVLAVFMPILVGLVTTKVTSGELKAWLLAGSTLVTSTLAQMAQAIANSTSFDVGLALLAAIPAFAISAATYYGLWKPTGAAEAAQGLEVTTLVDRDKI